MFTASWEIMLGEKLGMLFVGFLFLLFTVIIGASCGWIFLSRFERLMLIKPSPRGCIISSGCMMAGIFPCVFILVVRMCVRSAALCIAGAVGLFDVVIMDVLVTL